MLTRREVVIEKPFQDRRYYDHQRKVQSALPRIDAGPPQRFAHLDVKLKKLRIEKDRQDKICQDNIRLLHRLAIIMRTKRMDDINSSSKGPFEKKTKPVKKIDQEQQRNLESPVASSFLERVTNEAMRRAPLIHQRNIIQHRAPHGFCPVPKLRIGPDRYVESPHLSNIRDIYSIKSGHPKRRTTKSENSSESRSLPAVEVHHKSVQISLSYQNSESFFTTHTSFNGRTTIDEVEDFEEYSEDFIEEKQSDAEIAKKIINPTESDGSVADDSVLSCSGFTETEEASVVRNTNDVTADSDENVKAVLLGAKTPNITIDEASDDDFYD